jgi:tRNA-dihydrouridine synthase C
MWTVAAASSASAAANAARSTPKKSTSVQPPPRRDYAALFARGKDGKGCPPLFLAPMEGLGDRRLRRALALSTGGFDEACREFTRVPGTLSQGAKPEKILRGIALNGYDAEELMKDGVGVGGVGGGEGLDGEGVGGGGGGGASSPVCIASRTPSLLAAQLMGSNVELLEKCARVLAEEGGAPRVGPTLLPQRYYYLQPKHTQSMTASSQDGPCNQTDTPGSECQPYPRVDLNCGCPANLVTGKGAGSSLLRNPYDVEACVAAVVRGTAGTGTAVSLKLRSGYDDRGLLRENLLAAQVGLPLFTHVIAVRLNTVDDSRYGSCNCNRSDIREWSGNPPTRGLAARSSSRCTRARERRATRAGRSGRTSRSPWTCWTSP